MTIANTNTGRTSMDPVTFEVVRNAVINLSLIHI